ncbi:MAG: tRNA (adenine-N1)-methyltransferase [Candidatus Altiarchaeota archaeon]
MRLLIDHKGQRYLVKDGEDLHTKYGLLKSGDIDSAKPGGTLTSNTGVRFTVIDPDILDFISKARRGPQAMTLKDMSLIAGYAGLHTGSRVVEAGTGSGLFTMYLAHIIHPGRVVTYEVREDHASIARSNFERFGIGNVELKLQDVYEGIDEGGLDAVLLDLTEPWRVVEHARKALNVGGRLVSYSPSINQSRQLAEKLEGFEYETFECILREWKEESMRPDTRMLGHTGFLTVARRLR